MPRAASPKAPRKILRITPAAPGGRGVPIQPPFEAGLSPALDKASCGPARPRLADSRGGAPPPPWGWSQGCTALLGRQCSPWTSQALVWG